MRERLKGKKAKTGKDENDQESECLYNKESRKFRK